MKKSIVRYTILTISLLFMAGCKEFGSRVTTLDLESNMLSHAVHNIGAHSKNNESEKALREDFDDLYERRVKIASEGLPKHFTYQSSQFFQERTKLSAIANYKVAPPVNTKDKIEILTSSFETDEAEIKQGVITLTFSNNTHVDETNGVMKWETRKDGTKHLVITWNENETLFSVSYKMPSDPDISFLPYFLEKQTSP